MYVVYLLCLKFTCTQVLSALGCMFCTDNLNYLTLDKWHFSCSKFDHYSTIKSYFVGSQKKWHNETIILSTHNMGFGWVISEILLGKHQFTLNTLNLVLWIFHQKWNITLWCSCIGCQVSAFGLGDNWVRYPVDSYQWLWKWK